MKIITALTLWITVSGCTLSMNSALEKTTDENKDDSGNIIYSLQCSSSPLHLTMGLIKLLVSEGEDLQAIDCEGMTPYDLAVKSNIHEIILLTHLEKKKEVNKNEMENCRSTPLHHAIHSMIGLVDRGANKEALDCFNLTPLDIVNSTSSKLVLSVMKENDKKIDMVCNSTGIHKAVLEENIQALELLPRGDANMYATDCDGRTPMDLAISNKNPKAILALIEAQYDVNRKNSEGKTLLQQIISTGHPETTKLLLDLGIKGVLNREGYNLLLDALKSDNESIAKFLIDLGVNLNKQNEDGDTLVHKFSEEGNAQAIFHLKTFNVLDKTLVNIINKRDENALSKAVKGNYPSVVNILLASGANTSNLVEDGKTYLHVAIQNKSRDALLALLEYGLPVDEKDKKGISPMLYAVRNDDTDSMDILKEFSPDLKQKFGNYSNSLLHEAALSGSIKALAWLLDNGLTLEEKNIENFTALHHAAKSGNVLIVKDLISRKANVNALTIYNDTPLHWASLNGNLTVVQDIIQNGGDVNVKQKSDLTPLHIAAWQGYLDIVKELITKGAAVNPSNVNGQSPLQFAEKLNHKEVVDYLKSQGATNK